MLLRSTTALALSWLFAAGAAPVLAQAPTLETVASLDQRPGNVAVSGAGRVFATLHPLGAPSTQLVEIKDGKAIAFPNADLQKGKAAPSDAKFDTVLGIVADRKDRLWVIDIGLELGKTRLWAIDIATGAVLEKIELPATIAPKGSFVQDLAIDEQNGWAFLADIADPGLITVDLATKAVRRFGKHASLQSEDIDMVIDGKVTKFGGKPARVGVNPVTLSADRTTLYFGSMNGRTWYKVPTVLFREGKSDDAIGTAIEAVGPKPISDGAATDATGRHYFTDLQRNAIVRLSADGKALTTLIADKRLNWPDNVALGPDNWVYAPANQLQLAPAFTGGADEGKAPYFIYRFRRD